MLLGRGEEKTGGREKPTLLADAFEAVIGAVYLDGGYGKARDFISRALRHALDQNSLRLEDENFKSRLLEYLQAGGLGVPRYVTVNEEGPDHDRTFTVEVLIGATSCGVGYGKNKKDAEQVAAEQALRHFTTGGA
jgi:ribonuclease-3